MFVPNSKEVQSAEVIKRIRSIRRYHNYSYDYMAKALDITSQEYQAYENCEKEAPYAFLYTCAQIFSMDVNELIEGSAPDQNISAVTRAGEGLITKNVQGTVVRNLASRFRNRLAEPLLVTAAYYPQNEDAPIPLTRHTGQEYDYVLEGHLKVQVGDDIEVLGPGDTIYFDSTLPHGMVAVEGAECKYLATMITPDDESYLAAHPASDSDDEDQEDFHPWMDFIIPRVSEEGYPEAINYRNIKHFNFAFDVVDALADTYPEKLALIHIDSEMRERRFTFKDIKKMSGRAANYLSSIGIKKGDRVLLSVKRSWQFWIIMTALCKIGATVVASTHLVSSKDLAYRFHNARINAVICVNEDRLIKNIDSAALLYGKHLTKVSINGAVKGWHDFDREYDKMSARFLRSMDTAQGSEPMLMFLQSYSYGMAKPVCFDYTYPLAAFFTSKYWNHLNADDVSLALSDTAWEKAYWMKLYGPWLCESTVFAYDFKTLRPKDLFRFINEYKISSFTAPASMYRALLNEDLSMLKNSPLKTVCTVGDNLEPEIFNRFREITGLSIRAGYGLAETSLLIGAYDGVEPKAGSVGRANPAYEIHLLDSEYREVDTDEPGEICVSLRNGTPVGLMKEIYNDEARTKKLTEGGYFHTGTLAWKDEEGYFWAIGRIDDVIECFGYRIGPEEVESTILELPYVVECGVSAVPDEVCTQIVKASIVLTPDKEPTEELKSDIQNYVKENTASYRYPRIVEFRTELPKDANGVVIRSKL